MKIKKVVKILKGEHVENANGTCKIQHNREAEAIINHGYCMTNTSLAYRRQARIDWIEDNNLYSTGSIGINKALWFVKVKFGGFSKKLIKAGFSVVDILGNLSTDGYTGQYICVQISKGNKPNEDKVSSMRMATLRHADTDYDSINKSGMSDFEVRELRRYANNIIR